MSELTPLSALGSAISGVGALSAPDPKAFGAALARAKQQLPASEASLLGLGGTAPTNLSTPAGRALSMLQTYEQEMANEILQQARASKDTGFTDALDMASIVALDPSKPFAPVPTEASMLQSLMS